MKISRRSLLFPLAFLPFFWDYYIFAIKMLDILALGIAVFCIIFIRSIHLKPIIRVRVLLFLSFFMFYALVGLVTNADFKGFLGLIFGISYFTFTCMYFSVEDVNKYSRWILVMMVSTFFFQFFSVFIFGEPINYHGILGEVPRLQNSFGYRTSGLYLEPTSYCAMMFLIITIRFINNHFGRWEAVGILTIFLSASLYGVFVILALMLMWAIKSNHFKKLALYSGVLLVALSLHISIFAESILSPHLQFLLFERLPAIVTDESVSIRYGLDETGLSITQIIFGSGLSTLNPGARGYSGLSYLVGGVGLLGLLIFLMLLINLFRARLTLIIPSIFVILMSSYYWTFMVFWMWLAWLYISVAIGPQKSINMSTN